MKKQLVIVGIMLVLIIVEFSGCEEDKDDHNTVEYSRFFGTWYTNTLDVQDWIFNSSKELIVFSNDTRFSTGLFELTAGKLWLFNHTVSYDYVFSNNDHTLTLTVIGDDLGHPTSVVLTKSGNER